MVESILTAAKYGGDQAIAGGRGDGKTSIAECVATYCVLTGILSFAAIFAATGPDAERIIGNIKERLETHERLIADYPEVCAPIVALEGNANRAHSQTCTGRIGNVRFAKHRTRFRWGGREIRLPDVPGSRSSGAIIAARGLDGSVRGLKVGNQRPDLAVIDDPDTEESAISEQQAEKIEKKIDRTISGLAGPGKTIARVMLTTLQSQICVSYKYTDPKEKPSWQGKRFRLLEKKPDREDLWEDYITLRQQNQQDGDRFGRGAHQFYLDHRKEMDRGAVINNPCRHDQTVLPDGSIQEVSTLQFCYNLIAKIGEDAFATEYQNDPPEEDKPEGSGLTAHLVQHRLSHYPKGLVPPDCQTITGGIDIGKYYLHWILAAWRADATGFVIDYGVQETHADKQLEDKALDLAIHRALHDWRDTTEAQSYRTADEQPRQVDGILVDAGYREMAVVHFCKEAGLTYRPAMGFGQSSGGATRARFTVPSGSTDKKKVGDRWFLSKKPWGWLVCMDSDNWKQWVHDRFLTPADRPGTMLLYGEEHRPHTSFAKHITCEEQIEEFVRGKGMIRRWQQKHRNNHWLDALYMAAVAASMRGIRLMGRKRSEVRGQGSGKKKRVSLSELQAKRRAERGRKSE
jgi:hypothetical protein